jgi:subtilisin family serine protease
MKRKIVGILVTTLLIATALPAVGIMNVNIGISKEIDNKPNCIVHLYVIPNDPDFSEQWALDNTGQTGGTPDCDIDAPEAWDIETGNGDVVIAIIDSGIDYTHPELVDKIWTNEDEIPDNGIDDDSNGYIDDYHGYDFKNDDVDTLDEHGHGTVIAGVIGAETNNDIGIAGICWDCQIMPLKYWNTDVRTEVYIDRIVNLIEAIEYAADNGANVISMSVGAVEEFFTPEEFIQFKDAIDYAYAKGCVLVAAALNDDTSDPYYPGAWNNVICVAGTDHNDNRMDYQYPNNGQIVISNYGEWVDVAAPGEEIFTTSPTYDCVITELGREYDYTLMSGTSLSTPHVAGLVALLISKNPTYSQEKIMDIIKANVDPYDSTYDLGTGRINAYKALTEFNVAPEKPETPTGPTSGKPGTEYTFTTSTTDPDGDAISYMWNWGDGNFSEWLDTNEASYTWEQEAKFNISVRAKDIYGAESDWSDPLAFSTPKNKPYINTPFLRFLENHLHMFPLLRQLLDL